MYDSISMTGIYLVSSNKEPFAFDVMSDTPLCIHDRPQWSPSAWLSLEIVAVTIYANYSRLCLHQQVENYMKM